MLKSMFYRFVPVCAVFLAGFVCVEVSSANADIPAGWKLTSRQSGYILFEKSSPKTEFSYYVYKITDGGSRSTKSYAMEFMSNVKGKNLRPVPKVKGWEYSYVGNLPCATVVTREKNENSEDVVVLINLCGKADKTEVSSLISISRNQFH